MRMMTLLKRTFLDMVIKGQRNVTENDELIEENITGHGCFIVNEFN